MVYDCVIACACTMDTCYQYKIVGQFEHDMRRVIANRAGCARVGAGFICVEPMCIHACLYITICVAAAPQTGKCRERVQSSRIAIRRACESVETNDARMVACKMTA